MKEFNDFEEFENPGEIQVEIKWRVKEIRGLPILQLRGTTSNTELPAKYVERILVSNAVDIILKGQKYEGILVQVESVYGRPVARFNCDFSILFKNRKKLKMFLKNFS